MSTCLRKVDAEATVTRRIDHQNRPHFDVAYEGDEIIVGNKKPGLMPGHILVAPHGEWWKKRSSFDYDV